MKYEEMLRQAVETEMDEGCHDDCLEDYEDPCSFYASNAELDSYVGYLMDRFDIDKDGAKMLQDDVLAEIRRK